ncbi:MAG: hypothetical protein NTW03_22190 [Verrucomicrobia bacterium]|nr:hypothetical protein [Verrucomicrobiota bacterium]
MSGSCGGKWWNPVCPLLFAFTPPALARPTTTGTTARQRYSKSQKAETPQTIE